MRFDSRVVLNGLMVAAFLFTATACASGKAKSEASTDKQPTTHDMVQMHEKMATLHKNMAECMKSGSAREKCHAKFMEPMCPMMKAGGECPMMHSMDEMMGHMHGQMGGKMRDERHKHGN